MYIIVKTSKTEIANAKDHLG